MEMPSIPCDICGSTIILGHTSLFTKCHKCDAKCCGNCAEVVEGKPTCKKCQLPDSVPSPTGQSVLALTPQMKEFLAKNGDRLEIRAPSATWVSTSQPWPLDVFDLFQQLDSAEIKKRIVIAEAELEALYVLKEAALAKEKRLKSKSPRNRSRSSASTPKGLHPQSSPPIEVDTPPSM